MTVSPFLNFTQALSIGGGPVLAERGGTPQGTAPPAGFEPARYGLEGRCSIRTELQGLMMHSTPPETLSRFTLTEDRAT